MTSVVFGLITTNMTLYGDIFQKKFTIQQSLLVIPLEDVYASNFWAVSILFEVAEREGEVDVWQEGHFAISYNFPTLIPVSWGEWSGEVNPSWWGNDRSDKPSSSLVEHSPEQSVPWGPIESFPTKRGKGF